MYQLSIAACISLQPLLTGVSIHSLYAWTKCYGVPEAERKAVDAQSDEMRRLKAELKRVTEERDILKKAAVYFAKASG